MKLLLVLLAALPLTFGHIFQKVSNQAHEDLIDAIHQPREPTDRALDHGLGNTFPLYHSSGHRSLQASNETDTDVELDCSLSSPIALLDGITLRQVVKEGTVTVELRYPGNGWVGIGFSPNGRMVGSKAVVGTVEGNSVQVYSLGGYTAGAVVPADPSEQVLTDTSIEQNNGETILTFTTPIENAAGLQVDESTRIIVAYGASNTFPTYHREKFSRDVTFTGCRLPGPPTTAPTLAPVDASVPAPTIPAPTPTMPAPTPTSTSSQSFRMVYDITILSVIIATSMSDVLGFF